MAHELETCRRGSMGMAPVGDRCCLPSSTPQEHFATVRTNPVTGRPEVLGFTRRLHTPFYEEARTRFGDPAVQVLAQNLSPDQFYAPETLQQIVYGVET